MLAYLQTGWHYLWNILRPRRKLSWQSFVLLGVIVLAVVLVTSSGVSAATWTESVVNFISDIILWVATLFLKLAIFCLTFIIEVAGYNKYLDSTAVNYGWVMVRDLTNMIFVVILLLIAFGTILGIEQYEWKKMLVKFVAAAILVNFSRIICGVIIDIGQVVMITFINGVAATAGGNLINAFGANEIMSLAEGGSEGSQLPTSGEVFMAAVAAIVFAGMMLMTMLVYLVILVARMVQLWILIVLSPFAFVFSVIPTTQKYASEWWQKFGSNVVSGPIIAFFLWLSFVTVGQGTVGDEVKSGSATKKDAAGDQSAGITKAMSWAKMANFAIAIGMLLVGADTAQKLGVTGGSMMSKVGDFGKKVATIASGVALGKWVGGKAKQGGKALGKGVLMNMPLVGGHAWQRKGAWAKNKLLIGGTKWNDKVGSRLGAWAQFGGHEKVMKERKAQAEQLAANMSSSVKGRNKTFFKGNKREGGIEGIRAYTDLIQGQGAVMKEKSDALRRSRKADASSGKLHDKDGKMTEAGKDYSEKMAKATAAEMRLGTAKTRVEIDFLNNSPKGNPLVEARASSDAWTKAKQSQLQAMLLAVRATRSKIAGKEVGGIESERQNRLAKLNTDRKALEEKEARFNKVKKINRAMVQLARRTDDNEIDGIINELPKEIQDALVNADLTIKPGEDKAGMYSRVIDGLVSADRRAVSGLNNNEIASQKAKLVDRLAEVSALAEHEEHEYKKVAADNPEVAEAFYNVMQKENELMQKRNSAFLDSSVTQGVVGNARGISYPKSAYNAAINEVQHHFEGMERPQMLAAMEAAMKRMVEKSQSNPNYDQSEEYDMDQLYADACLAKLQKERFVDDAQGKAEKIAHEAEMRRITGSGGAYGQKSEANAGRINEAQSASSGNHGGSGEIDLSTVLKDVAHGSHADLKNALGDIAKLLGKDIKSLKDGLLVPGALNRVQEALASKAIGTTANGPHWEKFKDGKMLSLLTKIVSGETDTVRALEEMSNS